MPFITRHPHRRLLLPGALGLVLLSVLLLYRPQAGTAPVQALENGLARTPPLGWNNWYAFGCGVTAAHIRAAADALTTPVNGITMQQLGYSFVNVDDCWQSGRDPATKTIRVDEAKFPGSAPGANDGMQLLATYAHAKGLKFGLYTDAGTTTCAGRPGSYGYYTEDALTYARWGVDFVKVDWCNTSGLDPRTQYTLFGQALAAAAMQVRNPDGTPHSMVYSICNWGINAPWTWTDPQTGKHIGNLWRTTGDIANRWLGFLRVLDRNAPLYPYAGPGQWNDPDILQVGRGGMTTTEDRSLFSLWAMLAAPLLAGNDIAAMVTKAKAGDAYATTTWQTLTNRDVIDIDRDPLGVPGRVVKQNPSGDLQVWARPLQPGPNDPPGAAVRAVVLFNRMYNKKDLSVTWSDIGLRTVTAVTDLWKHQPVTGITPTGYTTSVIQHDVVVLRVVGQPKCSPGVWFC